jgi:hypothetical protein
VPGASTENRLAKVAVPPAGPTPKKITTRPPTRKPTIATILTEAVRAYGELVRTGDAVRTGEQRQPGSLEAGRVVAAVSVATLASRISQQHEPEIVRKVRDAAREIGDRLAVVAG